MAQTYAAYSQTYPQKPKMYTSYYDNHQADAPHTEVTANSPTAPHAHYHPYAPANKPDHSYPAQASYGYTSQIPDNSHMSAYVPNAASQFPYPHNPSQTASTYGNSIAPGQSWARPADPQMNYPSPAASAQPSVVAGEQALGDYDHPGQGVTHFGVSPPTESIKVEPATQGRDFSGHDAYSQASHVHVPPAYNHPNHGYGYDASQQQLQHHGHPGYTSHPGAAHHSQPSFYPPPPNHPGNGHVYNSQSYQSSPQHQYVPPSHEYERPRPTYGLYSPRHHHEQVRLAQEVPNEADESFEDVDGGDLMLNTPLNFVRPSAPEGRSTGTPEQGGPDGATSGREDGYGQASHDDNNLQTGIPAGHGAEAHGDLMHHQHGHHQALQSHASSPSDARSPRHAQPTPTTSALMYPDGTTAPLPEESIEPTWSREEIAARCEAVSYQRVLQERQFKRQRSAQFEEFEANNRPGLNSYQLDADYSYSVAQNNTPHHHHPAHHHRQSSSSSCHSDQSSRMPASLAVPPVVPSQAYDRPMPIPLLPGQEPEKKDSPPKKPALACLFCRKRKIACGPPPPDRLDKTCNQCVRRKQVCEYPTESRRGIRKTPKDNAVEEPTVHTFVHGDPNSPDGGEASRGKARRKRSLD